MEHKQSSFYFDSKWGEWRVDYLYKGKSTYSEMYCKIYQDGNLYHTFDTLPSTRTSHPTKSQAKELIAKARKVNKVNDKRDAKISKILQ